MADIHLSFDQPLINQPFGRAPAACQIKERLRSILECRKPYAKRDLAGGDHLLPDGDGDTVDNSWKNGSGCEETDGDRSNQNACPIEKKN